MCSTLAGEFCCVELFACHPGEVVKEGSQVGCELLEGGQGILCLNAKLCIGMPASHYKHEIQDIGIVGLRQDAIKHWQDALGCVASG